MNSLQLSGVGYRYGATPALGDVALSLAPGESLGIIGPDGVGKSTLLDLIAASRKPQQGELRVLGADVRDPAARREICSRLAYMPQGLGKNLYPTLSVWENLDFFGRLFGQDAITRTQRGEQLLKATRLWDFRERPAGKLSGGMKQKLGLCCALIHEPDLLLLDEPTTGVDPLSRRQFWELVGQIRALRPAMGLLLATAYMEEAMAMDRVIAMDQGQVLAEGRPRQLLEQTGSQTLEEAFVALLPESRRAGFTPFSPLPLAGADEHVAISSHELTCRFGDFTAVDKVSLTIRQGEIFGFLGSNGCGKTTTMKMLTGLLPPTSGSAELFGEAVTDHSLAVRRRVGYMTQAFSLYGELSVRQNLMLHARLYQLSDKPGRVEAMLSRFELTAVAEHIADELPLGLRQRLQLAVAVLHGPALLILDEPTSGVDPIARDQFWTLLHQLSRREGVTIFVSTHFMNEAARCDRISLMHAGRILAEGTPAQLQADSGQNGLEATFIHYLEQAQPPSPSGELPPPGAEDHTTQPRFSPARLWAYGRREAMEVRRDPIRLSFALLGTLLLMVVFGYGISFDVERLPYALFDQDQSTASRAYAEQLEGSRYFEARPPVFSEQEAERRLQSGELRLVVTLPPGFGRDLRRGRPTELAVWLDGAMPFRAETTRGYLLGVQQGFLASYLRQDRPSVSLETRFRYNQDFRSVNAMVPGVIMLLLAVIPAMLTAVGVVREKELGSILNLYATPVSRLEFLLGKQLPYIAIALINALCMVLLALWLFRVPVTGSFGVLALGCLLYVAATTAIGLFISTFVRTQVAALFGAAILTIMPAVNFSGLIVPMSALTGVARWIGLGFPAGYFQTVSVGTFAKALGFAELWPSLLWLAAFGIVFITASVLAMQEQES
ncbi:ribosome-associated ATPase/putative transporter RbbA [Zobellella sp. DQSA1]|uniref:ribosome-associated ATPase/putative transporter RbbA n=1 Tax=Zobellella sp. DQSA1 TaxID=3342386 RepID=UPI0035C1EF02